jgi:hypothetical protein
MVTVEELIQEIFDEPDFESNGNCSDFSLKRRFDILSVRIVERDFDFILLEVLNRVNRIGKIKRTHELKTIEELELHLRNIRKEYPSFVFHSRF